MQLDHEREPYLAPSKTQTQKRYQVEMAASTSTTPLGDNGGPSTTRRKTTDLLFKPSSLINNQSLLLLPTKPSRAVEIFLTLNQPVSLPPNSSVSGTLPLDGRSQGHTSICFPPTYLFFVHTKSQPPSWSVLKSRASLIFHDPYCGISHRAPKYRPPSSQHPS